MKKINSKIEILTQEEIEHIHHATLEILETVGVRLPQEKVLAKLEERGATVDRETSIVKLPKSLVERALNASQQKRRCIATNSWAQLQGRSRKSG